MKIIVFHNLSLSKIQVYNISVFKKIAKKFGLLILVPQKYKMMVLLVALVILSDKLQLSKILTTSIMIKRKRNLSSEKLMMNQL